MSQRFTINRARMVGKLPVNRLAVAMPALLSLRDGLAPAGMDACDRNLLGKKPENFANLLT